MIKVSLPIFHQTDESEKLKICGKDFDLEDACEKREVVFYNINAISPYNEDDKQYTSIHSNGTEYICSLSVKEVEKRIDISIYFTLNPND